MTRTNIILLCFALVATTLCQAPIETLKQNNKGYIKFQNNEFLFTGGIHMPNDKYWCLHNAVYRKPATQSVDSYNQGRRLEGASKVAAISAMSDFLCSSNHLVFTDHSEVCETMANKLAVQYREFFTVEQFRKKVATAINHTYLELRKNRRHPRSNHSQMSKKFLKKCQKNVDKSMYDLVFANIDSDIVGVSKSNGMNLKVVDYVMLNVEDIFHQDKVAAKDAWMNAYPSFKSKCRGKKFSDYAVRYFIEAIRLRYKPRTDIPTPNQELLGNPLYIPETPFTPPKPDFPEYKEDPKKNTTIPPTFEFNEKPTFKADAFRPKFAEKTIPTPTPEPKNQTPGDIYETVRAINIAEPAEKPKTVGEPPKTTEKDMQTRVEIIEIQRSFNIQKALFNYDSLTESMKYDIKKCNLGLSSAIKRCEKIHGTANCQAVTPTYVGPKCPEGQVREGCCACVKQCPTGYTADKLFCKKPKTYFTNPRPTQKGCFLANAKKCEQVGEVFAAPCKTGFKRVGTALCVAQCPEGTTEFGDRCLRTVTKMGSIFAWSAGEE